MANAVATTGICLYALPAREAAVLKRVISFSSTQGRHYTLVEPQAADLLVLSDDTLPDPAVLNPAGCLLIRITDGSSQQAYDVLMQRPLLVTKVLRTLDAAKALLAEQPSAERPTQPSEPVIDLAAAPSVPVVDTASAAPSEPVPELIESVQQVVESTESAPSLYAQILGTEATVAAPPSSLPEMTALESPESEPLSSEPSLSELDLLSLESPSSELEPSPQPEQPADSTPATTAPSEEAEPSALKSAEQPESESAQQSAASASAGRAQAQGMHHVALVVDDSAAIRKQLELELGAAGIGAEFAETGEQALDKVASRQYDLIFLDIIMPGIDGYETCRQLRLRAELKKTPIIMLSAKTSPLDEVQGVIAGASTYLTKPVKSEQLQQTLKRVSMWLDNFQVSP